MKNATKKPFSVLSLCYGGLLAALVCVATLFLSFKNPVAPGYIHLGDAVILIGTLLLGKIAIPAVAIGSLLADLFAGYPMYCIPSFIIKGCMAAIMLYAISKNNKILTISFAVIAEAVMVLAYFICDAWILGYGVASASGAVFPNIIQGACAVIFFVIIMPFLKKIK